VLITSRRLVSFVHRHVAAISYRVTLLNAEAPVVIASEMVANAPSARANENDPRQASAFAGRVLQPRASYAKARRIVLGHATERSRLTLTCATDHALEPTFKGVWSAAGNFAPLPLLDPRSDQSPQPHR
jgi:alpha,alpha-trehalose phosphorylase